MNSLLSAISGQFSKSLLLSTMLPVIVFILLSWALVIPLIPASVSWLEWVGGLDAEWKLATLSLAVLLLTALLYNLNGLVIRFYEGYPWQDSVLGGAWKRYHQSNFLRARDRWRGLRTLLGQDEAKNEPGYSKALSYWNVLGRELNSRFPPAEEIVLPTRLGNVIRSFETYPNRQYSLEAITLWPRLVSLIDERYAARIDDAKSSLDFMLNSSLLCAILAVTYGSVRLFYPVALAEPSVWIPALLVLLILGSGAYLLYALSIPRAAGWGMLVKGAFDLYRWDLLQALGPWEKPGTRQDEMALWDKISGWLIYTDLTTEPPPDYRPTTPLTVAQADSPRKIALDIVRGARLPWSGDTLLILIQIHNTDSARAATGVSVTDRLPDSWLYKWGSARTGRGPVEVLGANPYRFLLGDLGPRQSVVLSYRAIQGPAAPGAGPERST